MKILTNIYEDKFTRKTQEFSSDKKKNMELWDTVDRIAEDAIKEVALIAGVNILDFGDYDDIKKVVELLTEIVKVRYNAEIQYVDENY